MRLRQSEFNKGFRLDSEKLDIILRLGKEMLNSAPELSKSLYAPVEIHANISFVDGIIFDKIELNKLDTILEDVFNSEIQSITIFSTNYSNSQELNFEFEFSQDMYSYNYTDNDEMRFTKFKNDIITFFNKEIANPKIYDLFSNRISWFYPCLIVLVGIINTVLPKLISFTDIALIVFYGGSIATWISFFFLPKLFPKGRILFGSNKKKEEKQEKLRNFIWTFLLYPLIVFIVNLLTENYLLK